MNKSEEFPELNEEQFSDPEDSSEELVEASEEATEAEEEVSEASEEVAATGEDEIKDKVAEEPKGPRNPKRHKRQRLLQHLKRLHARLHETGQKGSPVRRKAKDIDPE